MVTTRPSIAAAFWHFDKRYLWWLQSLLMVLMLSSGRHETGSGWNLGNGAWGLDGGSNTSRVHLRLFSYSYHLLAIR